MRQRCKRVFLALCWTGLLLLGSWLPFAGRIPAASAHAFVIGSDPIDGSTVKKTPLMVRIFFDGPVASASYAHVYAFPPNAPDGGLLVNAGSSTINAQNPRELDTPLLPPDKLPMGGYEVRWSALSLTDGHTTSGLIGFNLGASSTGVSGVPLLGPSTSNYFPQFSLQGALATAWDWLVLLALFFWAGILVTEYWILPRTASTTLLIHTRKQATSFQLFCLAALLSGEVINLILRTTTFTATTDNGGFHLTMLSQVVLHTAYGWLWLVRVALLALALLLLGWSIYQRRRSQGDSTAPALSRSGQHLKQLRQQARVDTSQISRPAPSPLPARTQARVTDAIGSSRPTQSKVSRPGEDATPVEDHTHPTWRVIVDCTLAALVMLSLALSNEITQLAALPISATLLTWLGLLAQGIWFGCLAYLGLVIVPLLPHAEPDRYAENLAHLLKNALPWLLSAIGVLLVSELFLGETTIQTSVQLLSDPYGRSLFVREALLVLMLLVTGYTLFLLLPRLQRQAVLLPVVNADLPAPRARKVALERTARAIKQSLRILVSLAAGTLLCLALMNFFAPPVVFPNVDYTALLNAANASGQSPATSSSQTQQVGDLKATLQVAPARPGVINTVLLTLSDTQGKTISNASVKLSINMQIMDMGTSNATMTGGSLVYTASFAPNQAFSMAGPWFVQVEVDRPGKQAVHLTFQVIVGA